MSAAAAAFFFLFPRPVPAVVGMLLLQTLAFIVIAGRSSADGIVLTGITVLLMGLLARDHPLVREDFYTDVQPWVLAAGVAVVVTGLLLRMREGR